MKYSFADILGAIAAYIFAIFILVFGAVWLFRWPITALVVSFIIAGVL